MKMFGWVDRWQSFQDRYLCNARAFRLDPWLHRKRWLANRTMRVALGMCPPSRRYRQGNRIRPVSWGCDRVGYETIATIALG